MPTKGKRIITKEIDRLPEEQYMNKEDLVPQAIIFGQVLAIFQELYNIEVELTEKLLRKYSYGAIFINSITPLNEIKNKGEK